MDENSLEHYGQPVSEEKYEQLQNAPKQTRRRRRPQTIIKGKFIRGPIPVKWMKTAGDLKGACSAIGSLLWFKYGIDPDEPIRVTHTLMEEFGVHPRAGTRAVKKMEAAGLITAVHKNGASPVVTIVDDSIV